MAFSFSDGAAAFSTGGASLIPQSISQFENNGGGGFGVTQNSNVDFSSFRDKLPGVNEQLFNADFGGDRMREIARFLENRGRGVSPRDTAFERFRESQFNIFDQGAEEQRQNVASNLSRRGLGGSSTGINQLAGVDRDLGLRKEALGAQIGLQELGRQDQALQQALGAYGQAGAAENLRLDAQSAGLENLLAIPALQISQRAAENAGKLPEEKEPGILGKIFGGLF